jgi:hypothetical protein
LHEEGRLDEAVKQFHITLSCASDVLNDALRLLDDIVQSESRAALGDPPSRPSTH